MLSTTSYIASPYTNSEPEVVDRNYSEVCRFCGWLAKNRPYWHVFSPIVHWHTISQDYDIPGDADYWEDYNKKYVEMHDSLIILKIPGWEESKGVATEIEHAKKHGLTILSAVYDISRSTYSITIDNGKDS